ncbi:Holliday junction resolvase RuvX [Mycoplasmopsis iners]|uniref:Holliday junction resolvase RuvX n=1 Tax=Mycoplasmopsis iners TaxID=76630 RepID=UPI0004959865|nr:Holliday junction resolvase RuvX [Mycoplasmopsis iners]
MRKLALDLGTKTCGFAISDDNAIISTGLKTIRFEENDFEAVIQAIKDINVKGDIDALILGYPLRSNGSKSERTIMVDEFAQKLKQIFDQKVYLVDEYGSTIKAQNILKSAKLSIQKRNEIKDTLAAKIILQDFLDYGGMEVK